MMDYTDRHFRVLMRQVSRHALLYTEMVVAKALHHGRREVLLGFDPAEKPIALQLGGDEPDLLAEAAAMAQDWGYDEVNLNVGCPSPKVKQGRFGACLMADPQRVAECITSSRGSQQAWVTLQRPPPLMRTLANGSAVASHSCTPGTPASAAVIAAMNPAAPPPATTRGTGSDIGNKGQGHAVVAIALTGGLGTIPKDMALMATAATAVVFGAGHDQTEINLGGDCLG